MAAKSTLELEFGYADSSTRKVKMGTFGEEAIASFKTNIKNFNQNGLDDVSDLLLSDDGASCTGIVGAVINSEEITIINLNDAE